MSIDLLLTEVTKVLPGFFPIVIIVLGGVFGSFFNCLLYRIQNKASMRGRSYCPNCKHTLKVVDLIPVFSWLSTWGHCRYCSKPFGNCYLIIELITITIGLCLYLALGAHLLTFILIPIIWAVWFVVLLSKEKKSDSIC